MRRIIINGRFLLHKVTGVERYARELVSALDDVISESGQEADTPDLEFEMAIPPETESIPVYQNIAVHRIGKLSNRMWEHISFPAYVKSRKGIALNLCNVAPLPFPGVSTVHDMKPIVHPEYYSRKFVLWYRLLFANELRRSRMILTGTKFSAKEIMRFYHIKSHRIHLIPEGWQHFERIQYDENALERYGLKRREYFFSMGSRDPGKNLKWIIASARRNPKMVYAVSGNVNRDVFSGSDADVEQDMDRGLQKQEVQMPENIRFLGYVRDEEAKTLMRECKAFLFPSFYEGFGLPPLEALSAGCPCIVVSDIPVMREIFEEEAVYIDPNTVNEFACRRSNAEKILKKYSWKKSAKKLLCILERM